MGSRNSLLAVSGACMALRSQDFAELNGFDPIYVNGQEDVDLCLRLNQKYQMMSCCVASTSTVVHHESRTTGRYKFAINNRKTFVKKWKVFNPMDRVNLHTAANYANTTYNGN